MVLVRTFLYIFGVTIQHEPFGTYYSGQGAHRGFSGAELFI